MRCFELCFSLAVFFEEDYEDETLVKILRQRAKVLGVTFAGTGHRVLDLLRGISRPRVAPRLANLVLQEVVNSSAESGRKVVITTQNLKKAFMKMFG